MRFHILLIHLVTLMPGYVHAQANIKPLRPGDWLPAIAYQPGPGYPVQNTRAWRNKVVILDFWTISCKSCIEAMPKLDSLQQQFRDELLVMAVTRNSLDQVNGLFGRIKLKQPGFTFITGDTVFSKLFPYVSVPHYVIIGKDGRVRYITYGYAIREKIIRAILRNEYPVLPLKTDLVDFNPALSLLREGGGRLVPGTRYYSLLLNRIEGFNGKRQLLITDTLQQTRGLKFINTPLPDLYRYAYGGGLFSEFQFDNRLLVESRDSSRFRLPDDPFQIDEWRSENCFCYESAVPLSSSGQLLEKLRQDLAIFFPYAARVEKRKVSCLLLEKVASETVVNCPPASPVKGMQAFAIDRILFLLNQRFSEIRLPILDRTGVKTILLEPEIWDKALPEIRLALYKAGFNLREEPAELDMLVITDKK